MTSAAPAERALLSSGACIARTKLIASPRLAERQRRGHVSFTWSPAARQQAHDVSASVELLALCAIGIDLCGWISLGVKEFTRRDRSRVEDDRSSVLVL